jgi:hypothetical protein
MALCSSGSLLGSVLEALLIPGLPPPSLCNHYLLWLTQPPVKTRHCFTVGGGTKVRVLMRICGLFTNASSQQTIKVSYIQMYLEGEEGRIGEGEGVHIQTIISISRILIDNNQNLCMIWQSTSTA